MSKGIKFWYCSKCDILQQLVLLAEMSLVQFCPKCKQPVGLYEVDKEEITKNWRKISPRWP